MCCLCNMLYYSISHHINIILKCVSFSRAHADKIVSLHSKHWEQNHRPRFACFVSSISNSSVRWTSLLCALILHYANIYIYAMRYHASSHPFVRPEWRCVCCVSTPIHVNTTTAAQMNGAQNTCENGYIRVELNSACQCITFISTYLPDERRPKNTFSLVRNTRMNECLSTACTHAAAIQNAFLSCWAWTFAVFCCLIFLHADAHLCVEHTQQKHNNNVKCGAF